MDCAFDEVAFDAVAFDVCVEGADAAGFLLMHAPTHKPRPEADDEEALIAWYFMEMMDE